MEYEIEAEILHLFSANDLPVKLTEVLLPVVKGKTLHYVSNNQNQGW